MPASYPDLDAAVLGQALLGDVHLRENLDARRDGLLELRRRVHDLVEDAVDAVPHAIFAFVGLDVNVRRTALDRIRQDDVHEPDDGRFLALVDESFEVDRLLLGLLDDLEGGVGRVHDRHLLHDLFQLEGVRRPVVLVDGERERVLGRHDGLDVVPGHELDVVHGEHVRRVPWRS